MSASLVGSEMCIRDRERAGAPTPLRAGCRPAGGCAAEGREWPPEGAPGTRTTPNAPPSGPRDGGCARHARCGSPRSARAHDPRRGRPA
eukprot:15470964-Alexandrium_andersonii.AAC.1